MPRGFARFFKMDLIKMDLVILGGGMAGFGIGIVILRNDVEEVSALN